MRAPAAVAIRADANKTVGLLFLQHVEVAFAAAHIQAFARRIVEQIVSVADDVKRSGFLSRRRVVLQNPGWPTASDEHAMVRLVERHGEVRICANYRPRSHHFHRGSIDHRDLIGVGYVHEHARP